MGPSFLPPEAAAWEAERTRKDADQAAAAVQDAARQAEEAKQRVAELKEQLASAQAKVWSATAIAATIKEELQASKVFAQHFSSVWERKEEELCTAEEAGARDEAASADIGKALEEAEKAVTTAEEAHDERQRKAQKAAEVHAQAEARAKSSSAPPKVTQTVEAAETVRRSSSSPSSSSHSGPRRRVSRPSPHVRRKRSQRSRSVSHESKRRSGGIRRHVSPSPRRRRSPSRDRLRRRSPLRSRRGLRYPSSSPPRKRHRSPSRTRQRDTARRRSRSRRRSVSLRKKPSPSPVRSAHKQRVDLPKKSSDDQIHGSTEKQSERMSADPAMPTANGHAKQAPAAEAPNDPTHPNIASPPDLKAGEAGVAKSSSSRSNRSNSRSNSRSRSRDRRPSRRPPLRLHQRLGSRSPCRNSRSPVQRRSRSPLHRLSRSPAGFRRPDARTRDLFIESLKRILEMRDPPFNCSLVNDYMMKLDRAWHVRQTGITFSEICRSFERDGLCTLEQRSSSVTIVGSRLRPDVHRRSTPTRSTPFRLRRSRSPIRRSHSAQGRRSMHRSHSPRRRHSPSRSHSNHASPERWPMSDGVAEERWQLT